ncbi:MAG: DUF4209 domain-containing protein [Deltaproteobacteria bacterium]|nr:DUF4209 domain-containing protein [Deltaproteobacteria bacterium]MBI3388722.1 DUF4209 domain-containing protein [Deltaproteobacteria bacterium]
MIDYWEQRATQTTHPLMRARYADLVWDFSRMIKDSAPKIEMAHAVIDATIEVASRALHEFESIVIVRLRRALELSLRTNDPTREQRVADAILAYEDNVAIDGKRGLWGFSFDLLIGEAKGYLGLSQEKKIITDLEARLGRVSRSDQASACDPFAAEAAARRLARYYRAQRQDSDVHRVLNLYASAFLMLAKSASPLVASAWIDKVHETLVEFGLKDEANLVAHSLKDLNTRAADHMAAVSTTVNIPKDEVERHLQTLRDATLADGFKLVVAGFLPDPVSAAETVERAAKEAPLMSRIRQVLHDADGRPTASVGSVEEDLDGRVILYGSLNLQVQAPLLGLSIDTLFSKHLPSAQTIVEYLVGTLLFERSRDGLLESGLTAYLRREFHATACTLIPEIEAAVRRLLVLNGGEIYRRSRTGGLLVRTLEEMLRDGAVAEVLGQRVTWYFRVLLTDARGWNLRNSVCHGLLLPASFGREVADRIFHAILVLSLVRANPACSRDASAPE